MISSRRLPPPAATIGRLEVFSEPRLAPLHGTIAGRLRLAETRLSHASKTGPKRSPQSLTSRSNQLETITSSVDATLAPPAHFRFERLDLPCGGLRELESTTSAHGTARDGRQATTPGRGPTCPITPQLHRGKLMSVPITRAVARSATTATADCAATGAKPRRR